MSLAFRVYNNGDHTLLVWKPEDDKRTSSCLGYAVHRKRNGKADVLHNYSGFDPENQKPGESQPSDQWPFQRFMWWDYALDPGDKVQYQVVPMVGTKDKLKAGAAGDWTDAIELTGQRSKDVACYFNRGIVAAQWVAQALLKESKAVSAGTLGAIIRTPGDQLRDKLGGVLKAALLALLKEVKDSGGLIYAALYELNDPELIDALKGFGKKANVVLANGAFSSKKPDENAEVRVALRSEINLFDRLVTSGHFAHNKFLVICDDSGQPQKVWTGSTNWTVTGLCTQANNGLLLDDPEIASAFKDEWDRVHQAGNTFPPALVKANSQPRQFDLDSGKVSVWFTPTDEQEDMEQARKLVNGAQHGIFFLMFNPGPFQEDPGRWTVLQTILNRHNQGQNPFFNGDLYIRGVVNQEIPGLTEDPNIAGKNNQPSNTSAAELDPAAPVNPVVIFDGGKSAPIRANRDVLIPAAIKENFAHWIPELLKESIAMVHSKVVVIDPFGDHPVVMTGSHNMGPKASAKNDDNLVIVENDSSLAQAYAVNIIAIYQQYRWRHYASQPASDAKWHGLQGDDTWQDGYLEGSELAELDFWLNATNGHATPAPPRPAPKSRSTSRKR